MNNELLYFNYNTSDIKELPSRIQSSELVRVGFYFTSKGGERDAIRVYMTPDEFTAIKIAKENVNYQYQIIVFEMVEYHGALIYRLQPEVMKMRNNALYFNKKPKNAGLVSVLAEDLV